MTDYNKQQPETIQKMFGTIADRYDRANTALSFSLHKVWNARLVKGVMRQSPVGNRVLDLCCGTGDIAFAFLKKHKTPCTVTLLDFCPEMLSCAKEKAKKIPISDRHDLTYVEGDAQNVPLKNGSVDFVTIAYGIRNVKDPEKCISECFRVLDKGGTLGILELTTPENPILKIGHRFYLRFILPLMGKLVTRNKEAYEYLCNSIHNFIPPDRLVNLAKEAGFSDVKKVPLTGGIATVILATKKI